MEKEKDEKDLIVHLFNEFFLPEKKPSEKNRIGLIYLIQPLILTVALMVKQKKKNLSDEERYEDAYILSKQILNFFVKEAPVKVALFDRNMSYIVASYSWLNDPFFELFGRDPVGEKFKETVTFDASKWERIHHICLEGNADKNEEDYWVLEDGQKKWLRWEAQPWYSDVNQIGGSLIFCEDITQSKEIQLKADYLTKINEELEDFAYMCPHDLQAHLRTLSSFMTLIEDHNSNRMDSLTQTYVSYVKVAIEGMKSIVQNSLLFTEIENHSFIKEHIDMNALLNNVLISLDASIKQKKAIIKVKRLPFVFANRICMKRVLENLILNSIKYCTQQPIIEIFGKEEDDIIRISLKDNGIGIPEADREKVFNKFTRLHGNQKFPGTGLGLSYCKKILEYHEGKIWIDSPGKEGSIFHLSFPKIRNSQETPLSLSSS